MEMYGFKIWKTKIYVITEHYGFSEHAPTLLHALICTNRSCLFTIYSDMSFLTRPACSVNCHFSLVIFPDIDKQDVVHDIPQITQGRGETFDLSHLVLFKLLTYTSSVMSILGKWKHQRWWAHAKSKIQTTETDGNYSCAGVVGVVEHWKRYRRCKPLCHVSGCV